MASKARTNPTTAGPVPLSATAARNIGAARHPAPHPAHMTHPRHVPMRPHRRHATTNTHPGAIGHLPASGQAQATV